MFWSNFGLGMVVLGAIVLVGILTFDLVRHLRHERTVTEWALEKPIRAAILVGLLMLIPFGLVLHFLTFPAVIVVS